MTFTVLVLVAFIIACLVSGAASGRRMYGASHIMAGMAGFNLAIFISRMFS